MNKVFLLVGLTIIIMMAFNVKHRFSTSDCFGMHPAYAATIPNDYNNLQETNSNEGTVYICTGPQSKRFHKTSHCRGLNSCSGDILAVSISKAKSMGRTPCKWCYK